MDCNSIGFSEKDYWEAFGRPQALLFCAGMCIGFFETMWVSVGVGLMMFYYLLVRNDPAYLYVLRNAEWRKVTLAMMFMVGLISSLFTLFGYEKKSSLFIGVIVVLVLAAIERYLAKIFSNKLFRNS
ncbi:MAG: hypothetical protein OEW58_12900 [Gammaproteobacteria bacterium]|nr:hypothetical protein [Gammaproteobacteria bacterium]